MRSCGDVALTRRAQAKTKCFSLKKVWCLGMVRFREKRRGVREVQKVLPSMSHTTTVACSQANDLFSCSTTMLKR